MLRLFLFELFAFSIPFLIYGFYVMALNKQKEGAGVWEHAPIFNMAMTGLLLVGAGIVGYGMFWS